MIYPLFVSSPPNSLCVESIGGGGGMANEGRLMGIAAGFTLHRLKVFTSNFNKRVQRNFKMHICTAHPSGIEKRVSSERMPLCYASST